MKKLLFLLICMMVSGYLDAQFTITGKVTDLNGNLITFEDMNVTRVEGNLLTVVRAQFGTKAIVHSTSAKVKVATFVSLTLDPGIGPLLIDKRLTESGAILVTIKEGKGASPKVTDTVKVHYHGTLIDGTRFYNVRESLK